MIVNKGKIVIEQGVQYLKQWTDNDGNFNIEQYTSSGLVILNKVITGCGFTSYCLVNKQSLILVSPRTRLLTDKVNQTRNYPSGTLFYFNRERDPKTGKQVRTLEELDLELTAYILKCLSLGMPMKLLVTYDSFCTLMDWLEKKRRIDIDSTFHIAVDEAHCLVKDVKLKEYNNKSVLSGFIDRIFRYKNVLFSSATPVIQYLQEIEEFKTHEVAYYELEWSNIAPVSESQHVCKSPTDAFDQIFDVYSKTVDPNGKHCFDFISMGNGMTYFSYEAVIFLNSVLDIRRILTKYISKKGLISPDDVTVICANTKENLLELKKADSRLNIITDIPKEGEPHKTWTFVTRTAFEGVDFCSSNASTFVIANYNVESLSLDICSDIPQIVGRQRLDCNLFRNSIHIFYTNGCKDVDDDAFIQMQQDKMQKTMIKIANWNSVADKDDYLNDLTRIIEMDPNGLYLKTNNGIPEQNNLLLISERYCHDILKNHQQWFIRNCQNPNNGGVRYSVPVQLLKDELQRIYSPTTSQDRIRKIWEAFMTYPERKEEFFAMLHNEGYNDLARYFNLLSLERIRANGFNTTLMNNEIDYLNNQGNVANVVASRFIQGKVYSKADTKQILQEVYDSMGLKKTAKSTDLAACGIKYEEVRSRGMRMYRIL